MFLWQHFNVIAALKWKRRGTFDTVSTSIKKFKRNVSNFTLGFKSFSEANPSTGISETSRYWFKSLHKFSAAFLLPWVNFQTETDEQFLCKTFPAFSERLMAPKRVLFVLQVQKSKITSNSPILFKPATLANNYPTYQNFYTHVCDDASAWYTI